MKYSVLMSVYKKDNPKFLKLALESIYENQTRKPDEIIVVFDGELTKELYEVLDKFKKKKEKIVFYYPQKVNRGLGEALRIGVEKCTGDYIFRMDSDDISDSKRFEKQIDYLEKYPTIDVLGTDISEFNYNLNETMRVRSCPKEHRDIVEMCKTRNPMNHVTVCMKKSALEKCGNYGTLLLLEDYYLWIKMIISGCKLENLKESLVYVRIGNGFDNKRGAKERIKGWETIQKLMVDAGIINRKKALLNMLYINVFIRIPTRIKKMVYSILLRK